MGTLTGTNLIERITDTLQDKDNIRWGRDELVRYINDGQREVVLQRPDANAVTAAHVVALNTRQELPPTAIRLIEVVRNLGLDGVTPGRVVKLTSRIVLDQQIPDWHVTPVSDVVTHFMFDIRNPRSFYVYPRPGSAVSLEVVYSSAPTDLATEASTIALDDIYANPIISFAIMRAYQKDEDYAANMDAAQVWMNTFLQQLGIRTQADGAVNPNNELGPDKSR